jgi:prepilin-type N-terminal cleavage/methylation domain-containing protein
MEQVNLTRQKEFTKQKELAKQMRLSNMEQVNLTRQKEFTKQKGFTLIELAFVLIVMAIMTAFTTKAYLFQKAFEREEARADKTIQEIIQISEAMGG